LVGGAVAIAVVALALAGAVQAQAQAVTVERIEVVVSRVADPIANAFTTFGLWAIIIVWLFLSFFLLFVS
jgi:hypothetical protein